jgi:hypothetical protein
VSRLLLAEFTDSARFVAAARRVCGAHYRIVDAFTPFPVEGINELLEYRGSRIRLAMFMSGVGTAFFFYGLEYFSAAINYPYNSGGRPLNSWPAFMLVPFATGILVSAIVGFATFLIECGLPRLYEPLFAVEGVARASQDRFVLAIAGATSEEDNRHAVDFLRSTGAVAVREIEQEEP